MNGAYYNENEPFAAAWLRELIKADLIAAGEVDERSIEEVKPEDLRGFTQCHFFAGIGVWSYALRAAGWPDDLAVWTGSCPCQSFSQSGKGEGFSDKRHLWPTWFGLISERRPDAVFGEQVGSKAGRAWFDVVSADLEGRNYAIGPALLSAAGVGAPHIRKRLYFVADARWKQDNEQRNTGQAKQSGDQQNHGLSCGSSQKLRSALAYPEEQRHKRSGRARRGWSGFANSCELGYANGSGSQGYGEPIEQHDTEGRQGTQRHAATAGFWGNPEWIYCRDEKYRPVEPGTFPLVNGTPNRVGRLRGYGNAINAEVAKAFIEAYMSIG